MSFAEIIKESRNKAGFTLKFCAENLGISIGYLNDLEQSRALRPKMKVIYAMAGLYGIPLDDLCLSAERIPQDVFYKIIRCPELLKIVRNYAE
jgi:transcriptional regulator with XRE-family HTH domain